MAATTKTPKRLVRETAAARQISAWLVLDETGKLIAKIQAYFGNGVCMVNCWNMGPDPVHWHGRATGYGMGLLNPALSGCIVGGVRLADDCEVSLPKPEGLSVFPRGFKPPENYRLANWDKQREGYTDCYMEAGLDGLKHLYNVIQAI